MDSEKIELLNSLNARYEMFTEQFKLIEQQISELVLFDEELKVIESKKGEKMLVQIGKSVFAPIKIEGDEKLLVDVGAGYFVNKKLDEVKLVVSEQKNRLESFKIQVSSEIGRVTEELQRLVV
ncbi:MAG: prefoldin subunit alpha [Nanoarchaeota archaeon]